MSSDFDKKLSKYADLIVHVGLNLQKGQRLAIGGKNLSRGAPLSSAPLVRKVAESAYKAGAKYVNVLWDDDQLHLIRLAHADKESFDEYPTWRTGSLLEYAENADAIFTIFSENPDLFEGQDPALVTQAQNAMESNHEPSVNLLMKNAYPWTLVSTPSPGWATKVFPELSEEDAMAKLWDVVFTLCRLDNDDPVAAWKEHVANLKKRSDYLNDKAYDSLKYSGPGTDLTLGMPENHKWGSGQSVTSTTNIKFTANIPTEEVFSMPHKDRAEGTVKATMPLNYGGSLVEDFEVTFKDGRVSSYKAAKGEETLKGIIERDEGAHHLGEVALVPNSSPISQSGLLFYNTLYDENASCHIAIGRAYQMTMHGGDKMSTEEFEAAGGNNSLMHIDFMIGSDKLDIDGVSKDGKTEAILHQGEWAFDV
jgi:aminopeptidase